MSFPRALPVNPGSTLVQNHFRPCIERCEAGSNESGTPDEDGNLLCSQPPSAATTRNDEHANESADDEPRNELEKSSEPIGTSFLRVCVGSQLLCLAFVTDGARNRRTSRMTCLGKLAVGARKQPEC